MGIGRDQICLNSSIDAEEDNEDCVETLSPISHALCGPGNNFVALSKTASAWIVLASWQIAGMHRVAHQSSSCSLNNDLKWSILAVLEAVSACHLALCD